MTGFAPHKSALAALDQIEGIRAEISAAKVVLAELDAMPVPKAAAEAALDAALAHFAERAAEALTVTSLTRPRLRPEFAPELSHADLVALMIGLHNKEIRKIVADKMRDFYTGRTVLSPEERDSRAAEVTAQLVKLELAEEAAIRLTEAAGLPVDRRADANPAAVLALIDR